MKKRSICIFLAGMISLYSEAGISAPVWAEPGITAEAAGTEDADVLDETTITSDDDTLEDAVDSQTEALVRSLTDQFSQLAGEITSYDAYTANVDKVKAFYDTVVTETSHVLLMMRKDCLAYARALMASGESSDEIYEDLDDINDYVYEDGCEDLSDAVYDQLFEDISDAFYDGVLEDSDAAPDVASWSDVHSSEFNMWSHARSDVYDAISDCSSDIFDFTHHVERDLSNDDPDKASERINGFAADTQELEDRFLCRPGYGDTAGADELKDPERFQFVMQLGGFLGGSGLLDDREGLVHFHDTGMEAVQDILDVPALKQAFRRHLVQGELPVDNLVGSVEENLDDVHALLDLLDTLLYFLFRSAGNDSDIVDPLQRGGAGRKAPDTQVVTGEYVRNLGKEADLVLGVDGHRVFLDFVFHINYTIRFQ